MESERREYYDGEDERNTKESSSVYEKLYPMRIPMMAIGGIVFLTGLGMFIGGFAGLVADMDVKIWRTGAPNIGYLLMVIVSVVVMVAGGISLFCGCGTIRHNKKKKNEAEIARKVVYKKHQTVSSASDHSRQSGAAFTSSQTRILEPNGDVSYTVMYQYRGPPPGQINGIPAYPAPPPGVSPVLRIDPLSKSKGTSQHKPKLKSIQRQAVQAAPVPVHTSGKGTCLDLANVPRKLVLIKRV